MGDFLELMDADGSVVFHFFRDKNRINRWFLL